jgi:hypothetical protein
MRQVKLYVTKGVNDKVLAQDQWFEYKDLILNPHKCRFVCVVGPESYDDKACDIVVHENTARKAPAGVVMISVGENCTAEEIKELIGQELDRAIVKADEEMEESLEELEKEVERKKIIYEEMLLKTRIAKIEYLKMQLKHECAKTLSE